MSAVEPRTVKIVEPLWSRFAYGDGKFYGAFVETDPVGFGGFAICSDGRCTVRVVHEDRDRVETEVMKLLKELIQHTSPEQINWKPFTSPTQNQREVLNGQENAAEVDQAALANA